MSELEQPVATVSAASAISVLLRLFHHYAMHEHNGCSSPLLRQRIYCHLEWLSQRDDLPEILHRTCDELSDAWIPVMDSRQPQFREKLS